MVIAGNDKNLNNMDKEEEISRVLETFIFKMRIAYFSTDKVTNAKDKQIIIFSEKMSKSFD